MAQLTDGEWRQRLTTEQYHVLREKGTEAPGSGKLLYNQAAGDYSCAACGAVLFTSDMKFESTTPGLVGWPSFCDAKQGAVALLADDSLDMRRTEVVCTHCGSHLGHWFDDPSAPDGRHYCINSAALGFKERK